MLPLQSIVILPVLGLPLPCVRRHHHNSLKFCYVKTQTHMKMKTHSSQLNQQSTLRGTRNLHVDEWDKRNKL